MTNFKRKNLCDKVSKIKILNWQFCCIFHWLRCGILHFFCRWCFHGDICDKKWSLFGFLKKSEKSIFWTWKYDFFWTPSTSFYYIGLEPCPSVNSGRKRFVNPIKIELTRSVRMETTLGKAPAIYNGHQPPRAVYPYDYKAIFKHFLLKKLFMKP